MNIQERLIKIKPFYNLILLVLVAVIFFLLGRLSFLEERKVPIRIDSPNTAEVAAVVEVLPLREGGEVIGIKTSKKYYFPWCSAVKRSRVENQIHFESLEVARSAGYLPGGACKGLK